jgi:magnesium-dependent phosphatase-1
MDDNPFERIRLVVFDLDETVWSVSRDFCAAMVEPYEVRGDEVRDAEGRRLVLRDDARRTFDGLLERGYRLSAASRNHPVVGRRVLEALCLWERFTHPCLEWQDKDLSVANVLEDFRRLGPEPFEPRETLFVDDWPQNVIDAAGVGVLGVVYGWHIKHLSELLDLLPQRPTNPGTPIS